MVVAYGLNKLCSQMKYYYIYVHYNMTSTQTKEKRNYLTMNIGVN